MAKLQLDLDKVQRAIEDGYISRRPHPTLPLFIYNYTPQCQYEWNWTSETIVCRGLILDYKNRVVSRPFPKFFTPGQYKELRNSVHHLFGLRYKELYAGKFSTTEKYDGSLGILFQYGGEIAIASRGSFTSEQAIHATELVQKYKDFPFADNATYLFEIIYPENRIVVDYGDTDDIFLLTVLDNDTGEDLPDLVDEWHSYDYPTTQSFDFKTFDDVLAQQGDGEGFVLKFENGLRVKVKFEEYVRLHRILTNISERSIWQKLRDGESLDEMLEVAPDEHYKCWIQQVETNLKEQYEEIKTDVQKVLQKEIADREPPLTRKQLAIKYSEYQYISIMFQMFDDKDYKQAIWRFIRPKYKKPNVHKEPSSEVTWSIKHTEG